MISLAQSAESKPGEGKGDESGSERGHGAAVAVHLAGVGVGDARSKADGAVDDDGLLVTREAGKLQQRYVYKAAYKITWFC